MFIDEKEKKQLDQAFNQGTNTPKPENRSVIYIITGVVIFVIALAVLYFTYFYKIPSSLPKVDNKTILSNPAATSTGIGLPENQNFEFQDGFDLGSTTDNIKAEDLSFGYFYAKEKDNINPAPADYKLPLDVKSAVANYYDVARKIDLDKEIPELNTQGFSLFNTALPVKGDDFAGIYNYLLNKDIPVVISSDFLVYYFQNHLKLVYKEIEKSVFYDYLWRIDKSLYDIALARFKKNAAEMGMVNNPALEGQRTELTFLAVALNLLRPLSTQINLTPELADTKKFGWQEAEQYNFEMPDTIREEVEKEVAEIRLASNSKKSPILLYVRNYQDFRVPEAYKSNAKLNNFYLAMSWLNSLFPLYYQNSDCPDCLLDQSDWLVNQAAAGFLTKDLMDNQDLKNQWAIIYKFTSFWSGLRQELTYLDYFAAYQSVLGKDYDIGKLFAPDNKSRADTLVKLQDFIAARHFSDLEGAFDRRSAELKPSIGMRILQEHYWPNDYILSELTGKDLSIATSTKLDDKIYSACPARGGGYYRCRGLALDIINIISPGRSAVGGYDYSVNTEYQGFTGRMKELQDQIKYFNTNSWHNNIYWLTLDIGRSLLNYGKNGLPAYFQGANWLEQKDLNTVLGSWVNIHLPADPFINYSEQSGSNLGSYRQCQMDNYIEPNREIVRELIANNAMLNKMLTALSVTRKTNTASLELRELDQKLRNVLGIIGKELSKTALSEDDCKFMDELLKSAAVAGGSNKTIYLGTGENRSTESIVGIKLMALVYRKDDKNILAIGPVFNYIEK